MPRYDVFLEGRAESSTCYFGVAVMADNQKEAEFLGHEAGRVKHQECDEIEVVGVMPVTSARNTGKGRLCWRIPLKERALKFVKEAIKNGRKRLIDADAYGNTFESPAVYCENCNAALSEAEFRGRVWNFCPVCGFKMKDETEEQHETD